MLLTIWLFCPVWLVLEVVWLYFQKVYGNPPAANIQVFQKSFAAGTSNNLLKVI